MNKLFQTITCSNDDAPSALRKAKRDKSVLLIEDLELMMSIGVDDAEKLAPQRVLVCVSIDLMHNPETRNDDIQDVLSYADVIEDIEKLAQSMHFNLVETFAEKIAEEILGYQHALSCTISVKKPDIFKKAGSVGIEISRSRQPSFHSAR